MDQVSQIREKIDVVSFISEYITLKKAGRNFKAVCPFHNEKTPSLMISPERQIWHCFGCGKGGDAFTFLMEYENMEFPEALRVLAKRTGIELQESSYNKGVASEKEKIFEINKLSLKFYKYLLLKHKVGKQALEYLTKKRGLTSAQIENFEIGFAPNSPSSLSNFLKDKKKFSPRDLVASGVSFERGGKVFDFFKDRIMFPLYDHRGNILGFSGRGLTDDAQPKYINTKETLTYHKGSVFFGLNLSKEEIKKQENAILVEGEFDMISLFNSGIKNVVAIKGTALTEDQVTLISRFTPKITFCFDADSAGFEATKRSLPTVEKKGLTANIIDLKDFKDPDEAIKANESSFKQKIKEAVNVYDFLIEKLSGKNGLNTIEGKKKTTDEMLPLLSNISNEIVKEHYLKKLSKKLDVSLESLLKEIDKIDNKKEEDKIILPQKSVRERREILEEYLLALIVQNKANSKLLPEVIKSIANYNFKVPSYGKILSSMSDYFTKKPNAQMQFFSKHLPSELTKIYDFLFLYPLPKFETESKEALEINKVARELIGLYAKDRLKEISEKIKNEADDKEKQMLRKEYSSLLAKLKEANV